MKTFNIVSWLDRILADGRGGDLAVVPDGGPRLTWTDLQTLVGRAAAGLSDLGVRREERVLMVMDDTPAFPATFLGALRIGAVPVPANFLARAEDFAYLLDDSHAVALVTDAELLPRLGGLLRSRPHVRLVVGNGEGPGHSLDAWMEDESSVVPPVTDTHPEDMALWLYSSGSTGRPKGVIHTHAHVRFTCETYARTVLESGPWDRHFSTTKLFHAYGLGNGLTFPLWSGAAAVYLRGRPTAERCLERVRDEAPTLLFSVPTLYTHMLASPAIAETDFASVRRAVSAAEPLPPDVFRRFHDATGVEILDGIGSTEMLHIYCSNRPGAVRPGTSGFPVDGYELVLRDETGARLGPGESGELFVKGGSALSGYWHQEARTRRCLQGAWLATGDHYTLEEDGSYRYEGRMDDMMKVGGLWVSPIDIENRLMEHDEVREAAVVGVEEGGLTRIKAYVICTDERPPDLADALRAWCKEGLLRYQYPHIIEFVADVPRTATGKIQRFRLRASGPGSPDVP